MWRSLRGSPGGFIAGTELRPIIGWPKRSYYRESGVESDVFEASLLAGLERNFRGFEASLLWGKTQDQTAGNERERDRVRERDTRVSKTATRPRCGLVA